MTVRPIVSIGHPVLLAKAPPVADPLAADVQALIDDLLDTLDDAAGLGLAAPQIGVSLRVIAALETDARGEPARDTHVLVNPELTPLTDETVLGLEGCLSIPSLRGAVPRAARVAWRGRDRHGVSREGVAAGLFARVLQHEVDHLDGILFPMRMNDLSLLATGDHVDDLAARLREEAARLCEEDGP